VALLPMNMHKSERLRTAVEALYDELVAAGIEVLLDDRGARPGVMFADMELIGVSHRLVVSERGLKEGQLEYMARTDAQASKIAQADAATFVEERIKACRS